MSTNDPFAGPQWNEQPPPPPREGMSPGTRVVVILLIVFGGLALLCCGGLIVAFVLFRGYLERSVSEDPDRVRQVTRQIAPQIKIPDPLEPRMSMNMAVPFTDQPFMILAVWEDQASDSSLTLTSFGEAFAGQNEQQMRRQMEEALRQEGIGAAPERPANWETDSYDKEIEVRGQPTTFHFVRYQRREGEESRIHVTGSFPGEEGSVVVTLWADTEVVNEEQAVEMLQSIE